MKRKPVTRLKVPLTKIIAYFVLFALIISYYVAFGYESFIYALALAGIAIFVCML